MLSALSVFRNPWSSRLAMQQLDTDELDSLVESGLFRQADSETYDVHDRLSPLLASSVALRRSSMENG